MGPVIYNLFFAQCLQKLKGNLQTGVLYQQNSFIFTSKNDVWNQ